MRVVIDTNIFLSACLSAVAANKVLEVCLEGIGLALLKKAAVE
jgi:predicted nucleic acid-binding protein